MLSATTDSHKATAADLEGQPSAGVDVIALAQQHRASLLDAAGCEALPAGPGRGASLAAIPLGAPAQPAQSPLSHEETLYR